MLRLRLLKTPNTLHYSPVCLSTWVRAGPSPPVPEQTNMLYILISALPATVSTQCWVFCNIYIYKCISSILFVAGIRSNTIDNTEILERIYVFKLILKILWGLLKVLINQCYKNKRLLVLQKMLNV